MPIGAKTADSLSFADKNLLIMTLINGQNVIYRLKNLKNLILLILFEIF